MITTNDPDVVVRGRNGIVFTTTAPAADALARKGDAKILRVAK